MRNLRIVLVAALVMLLAAAAVPAAPGGGDVLAQDDTADVIEPWVTIDHLPLFHPVTLLFTPTFTGTATDEASPIASVEYQIDGGVWIPAQPVDGAFDSLTEEYTFRTSALSEGSHQLEVRASDGAGNVGTASFNPPEGFSVTTAELGPLICGTSSYVDGTFVWTDYAYDDHGADTQEEAASEFTAPNGDAEYPDWAAPGNAADLIQLQIGLQYDGLHLRAVLQTLTNVTFTLPVEVPNGNGEEESDVITTIPILGVAFDTDANPTTGATRLPGRQWPATGLLGVEYLVVVSTHVIEVKDDDGRVVDYDVESVGELWRYTGGWPWWWLETWSIIDTFDATVDPDSNVMETIVPSNLLDTPEKGTWRAFGVLGIRNAAGGSWLDGSEAIYDLAFVGDEIAENWQEQRQSAILVGELASSNAAAVIDFAKVSAGETELADGTSPGFHTYLYHSRLDLGEGVVEGIVGEESPLGTSFANNLYLGPYQPYLLWIPPEDIALDDPPPMLVFMHEEDFNHSFGLDTFGEDAGRTRPRPAFLDPYYGPGRLMPPAVVMSPLGRGERTGYRDIAEQDVLDATDDAVERLGVNSGRVIISGAGSGGAAAMRLATRYPDRWAAAIPSLGTDPAGTLRENLLNLPVLMINGELDDLAVGALLDADLLDDLGYDYRSYIMLDKGHYGAPAVSECLYANLCNTSRRTVNPARVVYSVDPATFQVDESTGLDLQYDSAYWVSGITSSNGYATVDVTSLAIADRERIAHGLTGFGKRGGSIPHYDGTSWTPTNGSITSTLYGVWGSSSSDILAVGHSGTILHYDGSSWGSLSSGTTNTLYGVWGSSASNVFAVGTSGTILHYDGTDWSEIDVSDLTTADLNGVWGSSSTDVFAVGALGTILHYDGTDWSEIDVSDLTTADLNGVWGSSSTDVFAVGASGTILHYDGNDEDTWASVSSGTTKTLNGVWGSSSSDVFAVGHDGTILHYDGNDEDTWASMSSETTRILYAIWGSSSSDVFAVGHYGTILHYDGNDEDTWASMSSETTRILYAIWGSSSSNVFAVGHYGTMDMCGNVPDPEIADGWTPETGLEWTLQGLELVPGELQPTSNVLNATLTNVGTVAFDLVRAGIATGEESTITVTTNSTVDVTLKGLHRNAGVVRGGALVATADSEGEATVELTAGVHELTVTHATFGISEPTDRPFVSPGEIRSWTKDEHDFTVGVEVTNTSIVPGTYDVVVQVEGVGPWYEGLIDWYFAPSSLVKVSRSDIQRADVFVEAGASQTVSLTVTQEQPAAYRVAVSPFEASGLVVFPEEPEEGEAVTISVGVTNTGIGAWTDKLVLKLDGTEIDSQVVTLKEGASESVIFDLIQEKSGEYTIEVGELDGEFIIKTSGPTINAVLGGLFVVLVVAGIVILVRRTRAPA